MTSKRNNQKPEASEALEKLKQALESAEAGL